MAGTPWRYPATFKATGIGGHGMDPKSSGAGNTQPIPATRKKQKSWLSWPLKITRKTRFDMVVEGKLHAKFDVVQTSESFKKRDFVIEYVDNPLYPQYITFQLIQERVYLIDKFNVGDKIEVTFNLRGREWTTPELEKKYFNTLEAWRISEATAGESAPASGAPVFDMSDGSDDAPADDLPF